MKKAGLSEYRIDLANPRRVIPICMAPMAFAALLNCLGRYPLNLQRRIKLFSTAHSVDHLRLTLTTYR